MKQRCREATAGKLGCALAQGPRAGGHGDRLQSVREQLAALEAQPRPSSGEQAEGSPTVSSSPRASPVTAAERCNTAESPAAQGWPCGGPGPSFSPPGLSPSAPSPQRQEGGGGGGGGGGPSRWEVTLAAWSPGTTGPADQFGIHGTRFSLRGSADLQECHCGLLPRGWGGREES